MTFQLIILAANIFISFLNIRRSKQNSRITEYLNGLQKEIRGEYLKLQQIHHDIDRRGKSIHLKISLDEIDINRVKDPETRNYLAVRKLICNFNPN